MQPLFPSRHLRPLRIGHLRRKPLLGKEQVLQCFADAA